MQQHYLTKFKPIHELKKNTTLQTGNRRELLELVGDLCKTSANILLSGKRLNASS